MIVFNTNLAHMAEALISTSNTHSLRLALKNVFLEIRTYRVGFNLKIVAIFSQITKNFESIG